MDVQETTLEAMDLLISNAVQRAGYNKTIQAQIVSCEDATIGKYRCRYQDSIFQAYVNNSDMTFNNGSYVYILIPNNDLSKQKIILGTTQKLGINYISQAEGEQAYDIIGTSGVTSTGIYYLDTNNKNYIYNIYDYNENVYDNISLDIISLEQYIKQSSSLIVSANIKTTIPRDRQLRGHYGIVFKLRFKDNASGNMVFRSYVIDEDNMIDNPYRLVYPTRQYQIFDIDGENFDRIESISIFNSGFPGAQGNVTGGKLTEGDIQISNIQTNGAIRLSESELGGVAISFYTPQGTFFTNQSTAESKKTITAQVRVKGKLVSNAQNIPFYWGRQNVGITPSSESYNKYLGKGWKCLNQSNIITPAKTEEIDGQTVVTEEPVVEWVPAGDTYVISFNEASAAENKIKVAIVYEGTVITKEIIISNKAASVPKITIVSSGGTQFYYDIGHPTLTCLVNNEEVIDQDYHYYWGYESNQGVFSNLQETTAANTDYQNKVNQLNALEADIANGIKFAEQERSNLDSLKDAIYNYKFIQRVKYNKVYDTQIKAITTRGIFKCSVYNGNQYLGTASITLTNSLTGQNLYSLVINNGSETFQYDERGKAPTSRDLENPQRLQALSFSLYDNLGELVEFDNIVNSRDCSIKWYFPIVDTLLQYKKINGDGTDETYNGNSAGTDARQEYIIYENNQNLIYSIAESYDIAKKKNQIKLNVKYKGINLTAETNFTFVKQGEPGTNGTDYVVRIVPNTKLSDPPQLPMITKAGSRYLLNYGIDNLAEETEIRLKGSTADEFQLFVAQLWKSGELVWRGNEVPYENGEPIPVASDSSVLDNRTRPTLVRWEILKNNYGGNPSVSDISTFEINALNGNMKYNPIINNVEYPSRDAQINTPLANIIKCSLTIQENGQEKTYYGTIPIVTAWVDNENYRVSLKDYTGFRYVTYSSDGVNPQYDSSHPFEFICKEKINDVWTDISLAAGNKAISYTFDSCGNVVETVKFNTTTQQQEVTYRNETNLLQLQDESYYLKDKITKQPLKDNQRYFQPAVKYNGACVNAGVTCIYTQNNQPIGKIFVPIHLLLNRYGLSEINDWDGNKVQINNEGGYILAPQMGAGTKDSNNNFTGVLMGKVKAPEKRQPDVGLLGYADGERTFFVNSKNGSAIFGKRGIGQIIIDPRTSTSENDNGSRALLYSSNFWKNYDDDGLPTSYKSTNVNHPSGVNITIDEPSSDQSAERYGMLIDLTTPQIVYANGNFKLDANGHITAKGGGQIAGWLINDYDLTAKDGSITLHSSELTDPTLPYDRDTNPYIPGRIYSENHETLTNTRDGFYLSKDGLSIGSMFKVTNKGVVTIGNGAVNDNNGTKMKHWTITTSNADDETKDSYIAYNTNYFYDLNSSTALNPQNIPSLTNVYLGTDGISLGRNFSVNNSGFLSIRKGKIQLGPNQETVDGQTVITSWNFSVDDNGYLYAQRGKIAGIEMFKHNNISELRAGDKYVDPSTQEENENMLVRGFILQSNGRVLGVGPQMGFNQDAYDADQVLLAAYCFAYLFNPTENNRLAKQAQEALIQNKLDNDLYDMPVKYNMWEFAHDSGIFRGGQTDYLTNSYRINEQNFRIQPANGYSRFQYVDVAKQLAVGGHIYGFRDVTYSSLQRALASKITFSVDCQTGDINATGEINSGKAMNTPAIYVDGGRVKYNNEVGYHYLEVTDGQSNQIILNPNNGEINASGAINSGYAMTAPTINATTKLNAVAIRVGSDDPNGTIQCGTIIPPIGTSLWIGLEGYGGIKCRQIDTTNGTLQIGSVDNNQFVSNGTVGCGTVLPYSGELFIGSNGSGGIRAGSLTIKTGQVKGIADDTTEGAAEGATIDTFWINSSDGSASFKNLTIGDIVISGGNSQNPGSISVGGDSITGVAVFG